MDDAYLQFEIKVAQLELPERPQIPEIRICEVCTREEFHLLLDLFIKIFPDEMDSEKGLDLREIHIQPVVGEGIYLARLDQRVVGFLVTSIIRNASYISYLGVLQEYRSRGVATALLQRLKQYLHEKNIKTIRCKINKDNRKTIGYISYLGFQKIM